MNYNTAKANDATQKDQRKALRSNMTPAEATLWRALKGRGAGGLKFRRQQGIGPYVLDFYCPERRLESGDGSLIRPAATSLSTPSKR